MRSPLAFLMVGVFGSGARIIPFRLRRLKALELSRETEAPVSNKHGKVE